jgi:hypothetical protein
VAGKITERANKKWMEVVLCISKYLQLETASIQSSGN